MGEKAAALAATSRRFGVSLTFRITLIMWSKGVSPDAAISSCLAAVALFILHFLRPLVLSVPGFLPLLTKQVPLLSLCILKGRKVSALQEINTTLFIARRGGKSESISCFKTIHRE